VVGLALVVVVGLVEKHGIGWSVRPAVGGMVLDMGLVVVEVVVGERGASRETPYVVDV